MVVSMNYECLPMAADTRKDDDNYSELESIDVLSDSTACLSNVSIDNEIPSYSIVYKQMRDVHIFQKEAAESCLKAKIDALNASKQCLNITLECQGKTIKNLEVSIQNDYILKQDYLELEEKYKQEKDKHKETLVHLSETLNELDTSQKQVADLAFQLELEKSAFEKCCDSLNENVQELKSKNRSLKSLITEKTQECEELQNQFLIKKQELSHTRNKYEEQKMKFKQKITESEVERRQVAYIRQMTTEERMKMRRKDAE